MRSPRRMRRARADRGNRRRTGRLMRAFWRSHPHRKQPREPRSALFETPIISMDSGLFDLIRMPLSSRPGLYDTALQMAWQRVIDPYERWMRHLARFSLMSLSIQILDA